MSEVLSTSHEPEKYTPPISEEYIDVSHNTTWDWLSEDIDDILIKNGVQVGDTSRTLGKKTVNLLQLTNLTTQEIQGLEFISGHLVVHTVDTCMFYEVTGNSLKLSVGITRDTLLLQEQEREKEKILTLSKKQQNLEHILETMESIFTKNDSEFFGWIDENDNIVIDPQKTPWKDIPEVQGKSLLHLVDLQKIARELMTDIKTHRSSLSSDYVESIDKSIEKSHEKYLDYIVGIGDKYEGGARIFHSDSDGKENVSQSEIEASIESIVAERSVPELFQYMVKKHRAIENNNYQSTEVTRTYSLWNRTLNIAVLKKMKKENSDNKLFLQYAKLVSGRDVPEIEGKPKPGEVRWEHSLDTNLLDPESASEAILYVFQKEGGILERIGNQITLKDPAIEKLPENEKSPTHIVSTAVSLIEKKVEGHHETEQGRGILGKAGFQSVLNLEADVTYESLNIEEKMKISILVRLLNKLDSVKASPAISYEGGYYAGKKGTIDVKTFGDMFLEIAEEGQQAVIDAFNSNLSGKGVFEVGAKNSEDFGFTSTDAEVFDLYNDIWGHGFFNPSDFSIERYKSIGQFGVVIIGSVAAAAAAGFVFPVLVGTSIATFTTAAMAGVVISNVVIPEGYDNGVDMTINIATDITIATAFGIIGGKMTEKTFAAFEKSGKFWNSPEGWKHMRGMAVDLGVFGLGTELARNFLIRHEHIGSTDLGIDIENPLAIEGENRFSYEEFHEYVKLNLSKYLPKPGLS